MEGGLDSEGGFRDWKGKGEGGIEELGLVYSAFLVGEPNEYDDFYD